MYQREKNVLEQDQQRAIKMIKVLEHLSYKQSLTEQELFSLEQKKTRGI